MAAPAAPTSDRVWVIVNTCHSYYTKTVPALFESLTDVGGVPVGRVIIVVGETEPGAPDLECRGVAESGAAVHFVPWANLDNNALIWASGAGAEHEAPGAAAPAALPEDGWLFYLHDTCAVTEGFWGKVVSRAEALENMAPRPLAAKLHGPYSMSCGFYSVAGLRRSAIRKDLESRVNLDLSHAARLKIKQNLGTLEDHVFRLLAAEYSGALWVYPNVCEVLSRGETPYATDTPRIYEFYSNPGIIKKKANWGASALHLAL
jgi:hypothetical protein